MIISRISFIIIFVMTFFIASTQNVLHQFGKASECKIDSTTIQVFLPSGIEDEGLLFIVNLDGKTCSSGKVSDIEGFNHMEKELTELNQNSNITQEVYSRVKCSLEKSKRIKTLILNNPTKIDQSTINTILNSSCR